MKFIGDNKFNFSALILILIEFVFSYVEAFYNTISTSWLRENIHLFTPILPAFLLIVAIRRRENLLIFSLNLLLLGVHYYFLKVVNDIGRAGAATLKLL